MQKPDEYLVEVADLLAHPQIQRLRGFAHHLECNRFDHSVNVSYRAWRVCRRLELDARAAARGGLLHDLFYYDCASSGLGYQHIYVHPRVALKNARLVTELTDIEAEIIELHMYPRCTRKPLFRETYIVANSDKYCCIKELARSGATRMSRAIRFA